MFNDSNNNEKEDEFVRKEQVHKNVDNRENIKTFNEIDLGSVDVKDYLIKASNLVQDSESIQTKKENCKTQDINKLIEAYKKQNQNNVNNIKDNTKELISKQSSLGLTNFEQSNHQSEGKKAAVYALSLLMRREYSKLEIINKLKTKYQPDTINKVITYLEQNNYLSQERFIEMIVRSYSSRGYGIVRIQQELSKRGVSGNTVLEVLNDMNIDMKAICKKMAEKKLKIMGKSLLEDNDLEKDSLEFKKLYAKQKQKILRYLSSRGFTLEECIQVVNSVYSDFNDYAD